ncbi:MAG: hypothetical protein IJJ33_16210, partial [Victivallales bacterium]|nr:hypothetical protein [Victivallales bacterium]
MTRHFCSGFGAGWFRNPLSGLLLLLCLAGMGAPAGETAPLWRWHEAPPRPHTTCFLRLPFEIRKKAKGAVVTIGVDDVGTVFVNGVQIADGLHMPPQTFHIERHLRVGRNVIAVRLDNHIHVAGLILSGQILLEDGSVVGISSGAHVCSSLQEEAGWSTAECDDSRWREAAALGGALSLSPWNRNADFVKAFQGEGQGKGIVPGRALLDDFADISSWLVVNSSGCVPGAVSPFHFSLGSVPEQSRDDGWAGALQFAFAEAGGKVSFQKNRLYKMAQQPRAVLFSADSEGHGGLIQFRFMDRFNVRIATSPVRLLSEPGWRDYRLELNEQTVEKWTECHFPLRLECISYVAERPATGRILIDDLFYEGDVALPDLQLAIHPEYRGLAVAPDAPAFMAFRLRNGLAEEVKARLTIAVLDSQRTEQVRRETTVALKPFALEKVCFDLGSFQGKGGYEVRLKADTGKCQRDYLGWLGVFLPNNCRLNANPMWFGIEDQEINTAPYEATLHASWMKLLGVDLIRCGMHGSKAEPLRGGIIGFDGLRRMWEPHVATGADILMDFANTLPGWARAKSKANDGRSLMGYDPDLFQEHFGHLAEFIATMPSVKYFEWMNEPDLARNCPLNEYCEALRLIYPILKARNPALKVGTGGLAFVAHTEKGLNFARQVYQGTADSYDIALFHCHSDHSHYARYAEEAIRLLGGTGRQKPLGNSESGFRSYQGTPALFYNQARELVKKIAFSKASNLEFHIWFMLQDYWDKYRNADDSFGLVTVDNQPKPSFVAYNELIRQLANTVPAKVNAPLAPSLDGYLFQSADEDVRVLWPRRDNAIHTIWAKAEREVRLIDIFGNERLLTPVNGLISMATPTLPFYLRAPRGTLKPIGGLLSFAQPPVLLPGKGTTLEAKLWNPFPETVRYEVTDLAGELHCGALASGQSVFLPMLCRLPEGTEPGVEVRRLPYALKRENGTSFTAGEFCFPMVAALAVGRKFGRPVVLDSEQSLTELFFDPETPRWNGKEDLSATMRIRWNETNLIFEADVIDQTHSAPKGKELIWMNDSLQVAIANDQGNATEFTVSRLDDGTAIAWRHAAPAGIATGAMDIPLTVTRD